MLLSAREQRFCKSHKTPKHCEGGRQTPTREEFGGGGDGDESRTDEGGWLGPRGEVQELFARLPHGFRRTREKVTTTPRSVGSECDDGVEIETEATLRVRRAGHGTFEGGGAGRRRVYASTPAGECVRWGVGDGRGIGLGGCGRTASRNVGGASVPVDGDGDVQEEDRRGEAESEEETRKIVGACVGGGGEAGWIGR